MPRPSHLHWDENNGDHLWQSHGITPDEVSEALLGIEGEIPRYMEARDGDYRVFFGETGDGRLLLMVGEYLDMKAREKRRYRRR